MRALCVAVLCLCACAVRVPSPMESFLSPDNTPSGTLPPFEVAKAYAFEKVLSQVQKHMGMSVWQMLGEDKGTFIGKLLELKGGGQPSRNAVGSEQPVGE